MNSTQISSIIKNDNYMKRKFGGIFAFDEKPKKINCLREEGIILNTACSHEVGEHWILIFYDIQSHTLYYIDPLANPALELGEEFYSWLINSKAKHVYELSTPIQSKYSIYCGLIVLFIFYYLARNIPINRVLKKFSSKLSYNDRIVSKFFKKVFHFNTKTEIDSD